MSSTLMHIPSVKAWTWAIAGVGLALAFGACDKDMKNLGNEPGTTDDGADDGSMLPTPCEPGAQAQAPAPDDCNTCYCLDDGSGWACTEIGCDPSGGPGGSSADDGDDGLPVPCEPGDQMPAPAPDDCNTCTCLDDGTWGCSEIDCGADGGACTPGDQMPAPDGCNTCYCDDGGFWGCTEIACDPGPKVEVCEAVDPQFATIAAASIAGDDLLVSIGYSGCGPHDFSMCWDPLFAESDPVQTWIALSHDSEIDPCLAYIEDDLVFSLLPMRTAYEAGYQTTTGEIIIHLDGWAGDLLYAW